MFERTHPPLAVDPAPLASTGPDELGALRALLLGAAAPEVEIPPLPDLMAGATALAEGRRSKVILPLARTPAEFALVRRGSQLLVDCYTTLSTPEVLLRERTIALSELLAACTQAGRAQAKAQPESVEARAMRKLAARVARARISAAGASAAVSCVRCTGGSLDSPGKHVPLSFGFEASIPGSASDTNEQHAFADVHALLFEGELWAFSGERRVSLMRGPIMLAAQRMVSAVRTLVDAWQAERPVHVRLRSGSFVVAVRRDAQSGVSISLSTERSGLLTWPALDVPGAALPVLRLAADLIRKLVAVDRTQSHNLRVAALRSEVRQLRRAIRGRSARSGFENRDPDRLRLSAAAAESVDARPEASLFGRGRLRYTERWSVEVDALDARSIFLCGERLIVATPKLTLALARGDGEVLWSLPSERAHTYLAGKSLLRLLPEGGAELLDAESGQSYARSENNLRLHGSGFALFAGGGELPPIAILHEANQHLIALDLRTGEPRWRFRGGRSAALRVRRAGRVLLVTCGDGTIEALDVASGEVVWRFSDRGRFCLTPCVWGELAIAVAGEPGGGSGALHGIELYTGKPVWRSDLPHAPSADPIATRHAVLVPTGRSRDARLDAFDAEGQSRWSCHDPGLDNGARTLEVDDALIINTPAGRVTALDYATGNARWTRILANPLMDDVPRQLEPVLRHGALFIPSAQVHILRPSDGATLTTETGCDLVPDLLRVDERAWFYVAEESGHLRAYASAPQLSLVK
ncbi:MAG TPA: PQQ-binding-like beta-propeller repeat protein [Polyangiales bacterium]|nr:PQQ-binding-like beta-propeller repeat protein [Polyangiales bacterium]